MSEIDTVKLLKLKEQLPEIRDDLKKRNLELTKKAIQDSVTPDQHIIQAVGAIESIDKAVNTLVRKLRDWYSLKYPVTENTFEDHRAFVKAITEQTLQDDSMSGPASEKDISAMHSHAHIVNTLFAHREQLQLYLEERMEETAPNIQAVAGTMIGAKLIAMAGSLRRLGSMSAGTIQMLGAETALFRHLKNKKIKPPKHGIIFNHQILQQAPRNKRGKAARTLADTIAIASRVDRFGGDFIGDSLRAKAEKVLK